MRENMSITKYSNLQSNEIVKKIYWNEEHWHKLVKNVYLTYHWYMNDTHNTINITSKKTTFIFIPA